MNATKRPSKTTSAKAAPKTRMPKRPKRAKGPNGAHVVSIDVSDFGDRLERLAHMSFRTVEEECRYLISTGIGREECAESSTAVGVCGGFGAARNSDASAGRDVDGAYYAGCCHKDANPMYQ